MLPAPRPAASPPAPGEEDSLLALVQRLKDQIRARDRILQEKAGGLVAARDHLRNVFAALRDAVLVIDPAGRVAEANDAALELWGCRREDLLGREAERLWADPAQAAWFSGPQLEELLRLEGPQRTELQVRADDGQVIPVAWSASVLREGGVAQGLVGIARDVRRERRAEEEKLRAVQALAASVAHEIRNPLGAIQSSVGLLRRDLRLEGEDAALLEIVHEETVRISRIVAEFLEFARPRPPQPELVDLARLLGEVRQLAAQDQRAEQVELMVHPAPDLPLVPCDPGQVRQVVWNLLVNALDAGSRRVALRARRLGAVGVEVRVADDGEGMTPEALARAGEAFHTTKAQGSGLGLAVCRRVLEAHGGSLRLESSSAAGTTAVFTLPLRSSR